MEGTPRGFSAHSLRRAAEDSSHLLKEEVVKRTSRAYNAPHQQLRGPSPYTVHWSRSADDVTTMLTLLKAQIPVAP
jgi:hypothetical protein